MTDNFLVKIFEHNNWANQKIIEACYALSDKQLDSEPQSVTKGTIRTTLLHLMASQWGHLALLTLPVEARLRTPSETARGYRWGAHCRYKTCPYEVGSIEAVIFSPL
jgi:uncharacterized damage-inducible protein DinB